MSKSTKARLLNETDSIENKAMHLINKGHVQNVILTEDEIIADVYGFHSSVDGMGLEFNFTKKIPYIVRCVRNPKPNSPYHFCSCPKYIHSNKSNCNLFGNKTLLLSNECSHILALKHHPLYYCWIKQDLDATQPKPKIKNYAVHDNMNFEIKRESPLSEKEMKDIDPFKDRKKIDFLQYIKNKKNI